MANVKNKQQNFANALDMKKLWENNQKLLIGGILYTKSKFINYRFVRPIKIWSYILFTGN